MQTEWSCSNFLRSVYKLHGLARRGLIGKVLKNFEPGQRFQGNHLVLQLNGVAMYLKRDGRTSNEMVDSVSSLQFDPSY